MSAVDLSPGSPARGVAEDLAEFLDRYYRDEVQQMASGATDSRTLYVDAGDLEAWAGIDEFETYTTDVDDLNDYLSAAVGFTDAAMGQLTEANVALVDPAGAAVPKLGVAGITSDHVKEYVGVTGQLSGVTKIRSFPREAVFVCTGCGVSRTVPQDTREFAEPSGGCNCERAPRWDLNFSESEFVDHRMLKIQQPPEDAANGETQNLVAHVFGEDTTDRHGTPLTERAGEDVTVYGTVELRQQDGRGAAEYLFSHYLTADAITFDDTGLTAVNIDDHREEVERHAAADDVYERFYTSLAPQIHPTEQMELAMQVCAAYLFAAPRIDPGGGPMYRGDIHAALIGDPGMAKSVLLSGVSEFSPDAEHRSATGLSSDVGLVAAAVDDDFGDGGWSLKPGILVRAGMHAIIDEIDKGPDDLEKINDALEGRQIATVDKAGMKADLKTRTGLLTSGNPDGSRFDTRDPLPPQIDVDESLLTRFDAIVLLVDEVDEEQDRAIAHHITESYQEGVEMVRAEESGETVEQDATDRVVDPEVGRAWVALGRRLTPEFTDDAADKLEEFYVDIRSFNDDQVTDDDHTNTISATARQLEAGMRFSMAFARMRLSDRVEPRDVEMATSVAKSMIAQTFDPNSGTMNIDQLTVDTSEGSTTGTDYDSLRGELSDALDPMDWQYADEIARQVSASESKVRNALQMAQRGELSLPVEEDSGKWRLN
jgi:replicative DNA helicase Mcm